MLLNCIKAEFLKLKHTNLWIVLITLPLISAVIGGANFILNRQVLKLEWLSLWTQVSLFYGEFFFPILIAIVAAYMCRLEHLNNNWNLLLTNPVKKSYLYLGKLIVTCIQMFFVQFIFVAIYYLLGKLCGINSPLPKQIFYFALNGFIAAITISSIQLCLACHIKSFAAPIGICLCLTFVGLACYVLKIGLLFPYSFLTIGMGVISQKSLTATNSIIFMVMNLLATFIASLITIKKLAKKDVIH